ncbi:unnamed protein product [Miscanthus lutarioriparius]|uniref:Uncharacterized protein n=1 Tax=Miscanthus lutarioriparius TaxID=422564 RepID=A0A811MIA9_9POAL|nr:unnamed protein product [Miscanthus lutarioriparius]
MSEQAAVDETPPTLSCRTALAGALSAHGRCAEALVLLAVPEAAADGRAVTVLLASCARRDGDRGEARVREGASTRAAALHVHGGDTRARREVEEAEGLVVGMEAHPDRVIFAALLAMCTAASTSPSGCPSSCAGMVLSENARSD